MKIQIFLFAFCPYFALCGIHPKPLPPDLKACLRSKFSEDATASDEEITISCLLEFTWVNRKNCAESSTGTASWLSSLVKKSESRNSTVIKRKKRSESFSNTIGGQPKQRKEYRMLSDQERKEYHDAINALKNDKSIPPNKYDALVQYHQDATLAAHGGPAFVAWHRYFLVLYELALQEKNPNVMLSYWDSTLDQPMSDPTDSVIWTHEFLGNGQGNIITGPFAHWKHDDIPLSRSVGSFGQLIDRKRINRLVNTRRGQGHFVTILEQQHNGVHAWVGGNMNSITRSPSDPVFFMHHAYIDCVWETFRRKREDATKYPYVRPYQRPHHKRNTLMGLPERNGMRLSNKDGYLHFWTEEYYTCAPAPSCSNKNPDCGSKWLSCDLFLKRCVSKGSMAIHPIITPEKIIKIAEQLAPEPVEEVNFSSNIRKTPLPPKQFESDSTLAASPPSIKFASIPVTSTEVVTEWGKHVSEEEFFKLLNVVSKKEPKRVTAFRSEQQFSPPLLSDSQQAFQPDFDTLLQSISGKTVDDFHIPEAEKKCTNLPTQNSFSLDCQTSTALWVFIPVQVVHLRHGNIIYDSHLVDNNGKIIKNMDIFSFGQTTTGENFISYSNRTEKQCHYDKSGLTKVKIASYGIDYDGVYEDHVFLDNRQSVSKAVSYIAVKAPGYNGTNIFVTATDDCGELCQPMILVKQRKYGYPAYRKFTGAALVTNDNPLYHSNTYGGAQSLVWKEHRIPYQDDNQIPIVFYCNNLNKPL